MEQVGAIVNRTDLTKQSAERPSTSLESAQLRRLECMTTVWTTLRNRKLVHGKHGSTEFEDFVRDTLDLSEEDIDRGLRRSRDFTGYFSTGEFRQMCKLQPEDIGLPGEDAAYTEACCAGHALMHDWSHPAVYHAGADAGWHDLRRGVREREFKAAYRKRVQQSLDGVIPPVPINDLLPPRTGSGPLTGEARKAKVARLKEVLLG